MKQTDKLSGGSRLALVAMHAPQRFPSDTALLLRATIKPNRPGHQNAPSLRSRGQAVKMPPPQLPRIDKNLYNQGASKGSNSTAGSIVCFVCRREKPQSQYSTRQLTKWKATIYQPYAPGGRVKAASRTTCKSCTPDQTTELTCIVCGETNGLGHFAKTQRKTPDAARCKVCINKQADTAPDLEVPDSDGYTSSDDDNGDEDRDFDTGQVFDTKDKVNRGGLVVNDTSSNAINSLTSNNLDRLNNNSVGASDGGWITKTARLAENQSTYSSGTRGGSSRAPASSVVSRPASEFKKSGWAKPEKIKKNQPQNGPAARRLRNLTGSDSDAEDGTVSFAGSEWTDRKADLKSDFDTDPWARAYK
ncbi:hypothetical protein Dda_4552 [Drechslerella dactyloides]|uniref:Stc1 domain-containing protein n=1 Tax=Drechslerella dactyloides TaxID=74499 RepID=A0AAD6IXW0_DREDA|nr:hypothetical protein Dda_4552 [Drechslerella dactyloides]